MDLSSVSWNLLTSWLETIDALRHVAYCKSSTAG